MITQRMHAWDGLAYVIIYRAWLGRGSFGVGCGVATFAQGLPYFLQKEGVENEEGTQEC